MVIWKGTVLLHSYKDSDQCRRWQSVPGTCNNLDSGLCKRQALAEDETHLVSANSRKNIDSADGLPLVRPVDVKPQCWTTQVENAMFYIFFETESRFRLASRIHAIGRSCLFLGWRSCSQAQTFAYFCKRRVCPAQPLAIVGVFG